MCVYMHTYIHIMSIKFQISDFHSKIPLDLSRHQGPPSKFTLHDVTTYVS